MRWYSKFVINDPPIGTMRFRRVFAWWPTLIKNEFIWLARFEVLEIFVNFDYKGIDLAQKQEHIVVVKKWVETGKRFIPIESSRV